MKKVSSAVWQFFDRIEEDRRCVAVLCKLCDTEYKYFGNTTNLRVHLVKKHPCQWEFRQDNIHNLKTLDETTGVTSEDTENYKGLKYKRTLNDSVVASETDTEAVDADDDAETQNMVRKMHASDEEWLEEDFNPITYEPKRKRAGHRIKRELITPPRDTSHHDVHFVQDPATLKTSNKRSENKDEYSVFGEYIANKLRKFETPRTIGNIQQIITTILWQAEYGMYDNADAVKRILMASMRGSVSEQPAQHLVHENEMLEVNETFVDHSMERDDTNNSCESESVLAA